MNRIICKSKIHRAHITQAELYYEGSLTLDTALRVQKKTKDELRDEFRENVGKQLKRGLATLERRHPTHILGFVTNMQEWMAAADLILSKPGGLTTSEALALGKPMFVLDPIPGQEAANSDFLLEHGAAGKVNRVEDLPFRLRQLLGSGKLVDMARAARALGRPDAASDICREVVSRTAG